MTRLSNRQYPMLQMFADRRSGWTMSVEDAKLWDQRPFRSMLIQGWIDFDGKGFYLTDKGRAAWKEFGETDISRGESTAGKPLTAYFDAAAYGLDGGAKAKAKPKRAAAKDGRVHAHAAAKRRRAA